MTGKPDLRVRELFNHVRQAANILEDLMSRPASPRGETKPPEVPRPTPAIPDKLAYSVKEVSKLTDVGRSMLYREIGEGRLRAVKRGSRTLILAADLRDWIASWPVSRSTNMPSD